MKALHFKKLLVGTICVCIAVSCSKSGSSPGDPCSGVSVQVSGTVTNPSSASANDGRISASATGGSGFSFSLNGGAFQSSGLFTNLAPGSYTVVARNSNGCSGSFNFQLTAPNPCQGVFIMVTGTVVNPSSTTAADGSISATASGSSGFTFSLNGGVFQASGNFTNLVAGAYVVTAKDLNGCSGSANFVLTAPNACTGVTITVSNTVVNNTPCEATATGSITATPSGGTGPYTFSLNGGAFQSSPQFLNLAAGNYLVTAKDANGCTGSNNATVSNVAAGPLFSQVKTLLQNNCVSCHNSVQSEGGMNWTVDCNIVTFKDRIKARAVDGIPSPMPPTGLLPSTERQKIVNWINAGGKFSD